ncbi:MAG: hypothetical protein CSA76_03400 [Spirochaetales bacterium]|nr:MAG: hypothetical protein CSA76_03400 [Spirochaetales bacterium]
MKYPLLVLLPFLYSLILSGCASFSEHGVNRQTGPVSAQDTQNARNAPNALPPRNAPNPEEGGSSSSARKILGASALPNNEFADPFDELAWLWQTRRLQKARARFWMPDVESFRNTERSEEWNLWRGRLFTRLWSGSDTGLSGDNISALLSDGDDIWAGTWTGGIVRISEPLDDVFTADSGEASLEVRTVNRIRRSGERIWVVRYGSVDSYNLRTSAWKRLNNLPVNERLQDIIVTDGRLLLATLGDGLWEKTKAGWRRIPDPGLHINSLDAGDNNEIFISTMDRGLYILNTASNTWSRPPSGLLTTCNLTSVDAEGALLCAGSYGSGAFLWDRRNNTVRHFDSDVLGEKWVMDVLISGGRVYFATFGAGLYAWDRAAGKGKSFNISHGLPTSDAASLAMGSQGSIWVGTLGGGLIRIHEGYFGMTYE